MSPPEARSHCYLTPLSHRKIDTHPLQSGSTEKVIPFRSHSCGFISLAHHHIKLYFKLSFTVLPMTKAHYLCKPIFPDIHKNAMVFKQCLMIGNEFIFAEVLELLGATQVQVCFSDWEAMSCSFHPSTFGTFHTI